MPDLIKCSPKPGGYAAAICDGLKEIAEYHRPGKRSKGLYFQMITNRKTMERKGTRVIMCQGDHMAGGMVANFCPICGGHLRDMSAD